MLAIAGECMSAKAIALHRKEEPMTILTETDLRPATCAAERSHDVWVSAQDHGRCKCRFLPPSPEIFLNLLISEKRSAVGSEAKNFRSGTFSMGCPCEWWHPDDCLEMTPMFFGPYMSPTTWSQWRVLSQPTPPPKKSNGCSVCGVTPLFLYPYRIHSDRTAT